MQEHDATVRPGRTDIRQGLRPGNGRPARKGPGSAAILPVVRGGTEGTGMVNWEQITAFAAWVLWMRFSIWWYLQ